MKSNIEKVFDKITLDDKRDAEIKLLLNSKLSEKENYMKLKKSRVLAIALIAVLSLGLMGFTYGNQIVELLTGVKYEKGKNFVSMELGFRNDPIEIVEDRVFFVLNEENIDITDEISQEDYYQYEYTDENGLKQIIIVGGTIEDIGFNAYLFDSNGDRMGSSGMYNQIDGNQPKWLEKAEKEIK